MYLSHVLRATLLVAVLVFASAQTTQNQLETPRLGERDQRKEFNLLGETSAFKLRFSAAVGSARVENAAALQLQVDKAATPFLSTLPINGATQFLTLIKPCGIVLPHTHQRATEFYSVIAGTMNAGIAQENGAAQNITFNVAPGEVFVVPQGLLHYNHNARCTPNVFFQSFNSADPGTINIINALADLTASGPDGASAIKASGADTVMKSAFGAFALDKACLATCGLPETGAIDGFEGLPVEITALFGPAS